MFLVFPIKGIKNLKKKGKTPSSKPKTFFIPSFWFF